MTYNSAATVPSDQTSQIDSNLAVTNNEFLDAIFSDLPEKIRPIVVSFSGNPGKVPGSAWRGFSWKKDHPDPTSDCNNYFSISAFQVNADGTYRRKKNQFYGCYCIILDDIGEKVEIDNIKLEPSWRIETSLGNYHFGYILDSPITDISIADQLVKAIINAGLSDPGATGPASRLARLPVAVNGKYDPNFKCRLDSWQPDKRYTVDELVKGLDVITSSVTTKIKSAKGQGAAVLSVVPQAKGSDVWTPRPASNPLVEIFKQNGLYKSLLQDGKHDITCPWVSEHTNAVDSGTAYFEPVDEYPLGGFNCLHGHCVDRNIHDLLAIYNVPEASARMKSVILAIEGKLDRVVDGAERVLSEQGNYYQRSGRIVTLQPNPNTREMEMAQVSEERLTLALSRSAEWLRLIKSGKEDIWVSIDPAPKYVKALHRCGHYRHLPVLKGVSYQPFFRDDLSLVCSSGYDNASQMYGAFDPAEFAIPENPSEEDARLALEKLTGLLDEFEFSTEIDRAGALCAILTAVIRPGLPSAPMFHVMAHVPGSGKSYLCALISALASAAPGQPTSYPDNDNECSKQLLALLLSAPPVVEFDNVTTDLYAHKSLCSALTSGYTTGRVLGKSETASVSTRALFLSSGNNVGPVKDMMRRCLTIGLSCKGEHPAQREFKNPNLLRELKGRRGFYVSAALTVIRAWIAAGKPGQGIRNLAGYEEWSSLCRQPLVWLECTDPVENMFLNMHQDPEKELLAKLLNLLSDIAGDRAMKVKELLEFAKTSGSQAKELSELLEEIAIDDRGNISSRRLGRWIARQEGRTVSNKYLVRTTTNGPVASWAVRERL
ncbi:MAG: hypothetical protein R3F50_17115 [Gammaproteobacteria bacterium]